ncbi:Thiamine biosynthesis lipoprotein ApbE precursor [Pelotomaculum sp. FP]|nr:Thiamine biosynthesis lipoprotein ApbE precursor [Pelotomaculum sp. FP]
MVLLISFCITLFSMGCVQKPAAMQGFSGEKFIMDTLIQITVYSEDKEKGQQALEEAFGAFERIHSLTDRFQKLEQTITSNDVVKLNENAGTKPVAVSADTINMIERSHYFASATGGAFDVTIGPVMDLWGFGKSEQRVPADEEIKRALSLVDYNKVQVDPDNMTVFLAQPGMSLDLGGVAKGYATDEAVKALRDMGIQHAIINAGGNVYALGDKPDGSPWRVGVQDPRGDKGIIGILYVKDRAVVTSGDYQRYFEQDGVRYHHIVDPSTGKQARGVMQATVVADSATDADILSTTLFVLGAQKGMGFVQELPDTGAIFIDTDKQVSYTENLNDQLEFTGDGDYQINQN